MKNVTFSADERLIEQARRRAHLERSTLDDEFRKWLASYAGSREMADRAMSTVHELRSRVRTGGRRFTRDERNER